MGGERDDEDIVRPPHEGGCHRIRHTAGVPAVGQPSVEKIRGDDKRQQGQGVWAGIRRSEGEARKRDQTGRRHNCGRASCDPVGKSEEDHQPGTERNQ